MSRLTDNYVGVGDVVPLPAPYAVTPGDGALIGSIFAIATQAAALNAVIPFAVEGVFRILKTAGQTFTAGALVYWDNAAKSVTSVSTGNTRIGFATLAALAGDAKATVRLNNIATPTGA